MAAPLRSMDIWPLDAVNSTKDELTKNQKERVSGDLLL